MLTKYDRHKIARRYDNERRLMGETLEAFHARENAKPPSLAVIYAANRKNRARCRSTRSLFTWAHEKDNGK